MKFINHYSVLWVMLLLLVGGGCVVQRRGSKIRGWLLLAAVAAISATMWLFFRPVSNPGAPSPGKPSLLEIQSPYCLGCVALKPQVDALERSLSSRLVVRRVDIQSEEGNKLAREYDVQFTPTFIFFDGAGKEQWRSIGQLDPAQVRKYL